MIRVQEHDFDLGQELKLLTDGKLEPGDQIVLVAAASAHREAAFDACHYLIDFLKTRAPFWKLEDTPDGPKWVDARSSDDDATRRWMTPV